MRIFGSICTILTAGVFVASCQSTGPVAPSAQAKVEPSPTAEVAPAAPAKPADKVAGRWVPTDPKSRKIYYNEFKRGKFAAYTVDGNNTLALGSYTPSANGVSFQYFSQTRKRQVKADCQLSGSSRMTCRVDDGSVVELQKA